MAEIRYKLTKPLDGGGEASVIVEYASKDPNGGNLADKATKTELNSKAEASDLAALTTRVGTAEAGITSNSSSIAALATRVGAAETNITSLTSSKADASKVTELEGKVSTNASNIAVAEANILLKANTADVASTYMKKSAVTLTVDETTSTVILSINEDA